MKKGSRPFIYYINIKINTNTRHGLLRGGNLYPCKPIVYVVYGAELPLQLPHHVLHVAVYTVNHRHLYCLTTE